MHEGSGLRALIGVLAVLLTGPAGFGAESSSPAKPMPGLADEGFLGADGPVLRDRRGRGGRVQLRGVNLGGWLEWQAWMCPMDSSKTLRDGNPGHNGYNFEVRKLLVKRFGPAVAEELVGTYMNSWISLVDLDHIQSLGFNAVRLTLAWDTFLREDGAWRSNAFERVDWLVTNAWQRGLYTILDYHAFLPPGADQDGSAQGYWNNPDQQAETVRIWRRIAEHYRGHPAIAMYDLLNEPNNSAPKGRPEPRASVVCALYDELYHAIRDVDADHLIAMEGMWDWKTLRNPVAAGYRNVVYSFHWYHFGARTDEDHRRPTEADLRGIETMRQAWNVPVLIGEFNFFGHWRAWQDGLRRYDEAGLNWTLWTFKNKAGGVNSWGVLTTLPGKAPPVPDLTRDSAETIREKWQAWKTTGRTFAFNPELKTVLVNSNSGGGRTNGYAEVKPAPKTDQPHPTLVSEE